MEVIIHGRVLLTRTFIGESYTTDAQSHGPGIRYLTGYSASYSQ